MPSEIVVVLIPSQWINPYKDASIWIEQHVTTDITYRTYREQRQDFIPCFLKNIIISCDLINFSSVGRSVWEERINNLSLLKELEITPRRIIFLSSSRRLEITVSIGLEEYNKVEAQINKRDILNDQEVRELAELAGGQVINSAHVPISAVKLNTAVKHPRPLPPTPSIINNNNNVSTFAYQVQNFMFYSREDNSFRNVGEKTKIRPEGHNEQSIFNNNVNNNNDELEDRPELAAFALMKFAKESDKKFGKNVSDEDTEDEDNLSKGFGTS